TLFFLSSVIVQTPDHIAKASSPLNELEDLLESSSGANSEPTDNIEQIDSNSTDFPRNYSSAIELTFIKTTKNDEGAYHVIGEIKNLSPDTLTSVKVKAHFYDEDMNVLAIKDSYTDPTSIEPNRVGDFDILVTENDYGKDDPDYFKLSYNWN
ncbi:MAG: hypothetical protein L0H55_16895, partial [Candidatus Nitrosocosmicus sp.]|nr:hypothetical protein [Candidatus Nitrosocosmicus sp.]